MTGMGLSFLKAAKCFSLLHKVNISKYISNMMCNHHISDLLSFAFWVIVTSNGRFFTDLVIFYIYSTYTLS